MRRALAIAALLLGCSDDSGGAADGASPDSGAPPRCGDGTCDADETACDCADDCPATCGDGCCGEGENSCDCDDCTGPCCGDGTCDTGENTAGCEEDCPASVCGDGTCYPATEDCSSCAADCGCSAVQVCGGGACTSCGNGTCEGGVVAPRVLFDVDVSSGTASALCGFMTVDDSLECPGTDVACIDCNSAGCGNALADDSVLWKVKNAITGVVSSRPEASYALARAHMEPEVFSCIQGGWLGPNPACGSVALGTAENSADILVGFAGSPTDLLEWLDTEANYAGTPPAVGCTLCPDCQGACDKELRPDGSTPLAGGLVSIRQYLDNVRATDPLSACRPYAAIVVAAGGNDCDDPNNPSDPDPTPEQAAALCEAGVPVYVIGMGSSMLSQALDQTAAAGCGPTCNGTGCAETALIVDNETDLAAAISNILDAQDVTGCAEDVTTCAADCTGCNNDAVCDLGEDACCTADACADACGDGCCTGAEDATGCPADCS